MSVRKAIRTHRTHFQSSSKIPVRSRGHAPFGGTASCPSGKTKVTRHEQEVPPTELEKLDSFRSKLEQSVDAFIKARRELEEIVSADGSSELGSSPDLRAELQRHRELTSRVESSLRENKDPKHSAQGTVNIGSSHEFLKSIMG